jgi:hypothetical protein
MKISNRHRALFAGILILAAYSMLTYTITKNIISGFITDVLSGLSVIGIPVLLFPIFHFDKNKAINYAYLISRLIEGILMILGGIFLLNPSGQSFREMIYNNIHIYFFISGALFFYLLSYRTQVIPRFISIWGIVATILLLVITIIKLSGLTLPILDGFLAPMILNELFLAFWLIFKGFTISR